MLRWTLKVNSLVAIFMSEYCPLNSKLAKKFPSILGLE